MEALSMAMGLATYVSMKKEEWRADERKPKEKEELQTIPEVEELQASEERRAEGNRPDNAEKAAEGSKPAPSKPSRKRIRKSEQ